MKITYAQAKNYFEEHNCKLLEHEYKNSKHKMKYCCICGNISSINWNNFKNGRRCKVCMRNKLAVNRRNNPEKIKKYFSARNCELLEEYKNAYSLIQYKCECGHISRISFANFKKGKRCKNCGIKKTSGENNYNWNPDRKQIADNLSIRKRCYLMLLNSLKETGRRKTTKARELLKYTGKQLQEHIRNHPNWQNVKNCQWEIDHIFPLKAFLDYAITDVSIINCLENLAPILKTVNRRKSKKYNKKEFEAWVAEKGFNSHELRKI